LASLAAFATLLVAAPVGAAGHGRPGTLDPGFGHGGKVFGMAPKAVAHSEFGAAELEDDGDLVVEVQREAVEKEEGIREIERRLPDGSLDPSFGKDGRVRVGPGSGLVVRPDGSILVSVDSCGAKKGSLLLLDASGNPVTDFGEGGCGPRLGFEAGYMDVAYGGAIFIGGTAIVCPCGAKSPPRYEPVVAKLQPNGAPDPAFGKNGAVHMRADLALEPEELESRGINGIAATADGGVVVASGKILIDIGPDGALSIGFGTSGTAEVGAFSTALTALPGGKLVVAASMKTYFFEPATAMVISRFLPNGTLDPTFGSNGRFQPPLPEETEASALAPAPGEGVLVAGETGPGKDCRGVCRATMFLIRIDADGRYDSSYGNQGILDLPRPPSAPYQRSPGISALAVSAAGAAIAIGGESSIHAYAIAATPTGALNGGFGEGGTLLERHFAPPDLEPSGLALRTRGEITVAVEGTSGGEEYGGFLQGFRADGRQTRGASGRGVSPAAAGGEIVPVPGGMVSMRDRPRLLFAVEKRGNPLRSYGEKGSVKLPKGFRATALVSGVRGCVLVLGAREGSMAVFELGPKGRPVPGFGHHGLAEVRFGDGAGAEAATVASNGAIVLTGSVGAWTGAAKLLSNGRLDRRFGHAGRVRHLLSPETYGSSIASLSGGVVIGSTTTSGPYELAGLVRLDARGHLVDTFGRKGAVRPKAEGRLLGVFTRRSHITVVTDNEFAPHSSGGVELRAYRPGGSRDLSFGKRGFATGGVGQNRFFHPVAAVQQPDGRIIVAGAAWNGELSQVELLRFR
jgi:uncharacterized delta-60 repeat protein